MTKFRVKLIELCQYFSDDKFINYSTILLQLFFMGKTAVLLIFAFILVLLLPLLCQNPLPPFLLLLLYRSCCRQLVDFWAPQHPLFRWILAQTCCLTHQVSNVSCLLEQEVVEILDQQQFYLKKIMVKKKGVSIIVLTSKNFLPLLGWVSPNRD